MSVLDLNAFQKAKEQELKKKKRISRRRWLGESEHVCQHTDSNCHRCATPIMPGMVYVREVYATFFGIQVFKYHSPECPLDPIYEEELEREHAMAEAEARKVA